jgi:hypothetical protein
MLEHLILECLWYVKLRGVPAGAERPSDGRGFDGAWTRASDDELLEYNWLGGMTRR